MLRWAAAGGDAHSISPMPHHLTAAPSCLAVPLLPGASHDSAMRTANRLKELVELEAIPHENSSVADVLTVSQGVVTVQPDGDMLPSEVISRADKALYEAKKTGRDRISVSW